MNQLLSASNPFPRCASGNPAQGVILILLLIVILKVLNKSEDEHEDDDEKDSSRVLSDSRLRAFRANENKFPAKRMVLLS